MLSRLFITFAIVIFYFSIGNTQSSINPTTNTNSVVIPPPPNVASFLKVADVPISNYNGTAQVSIPVYTLEVGDLKVPISLNYYNNGLKVTEEASWVGFGWNLNVGGVIHQNIVGNPDSHIADGSRSHSIAPLPIAMPAANSNIVNSGNMLEHGCSFLDDNYNTALFNVSQLISDGINGLANNEYDLYMYNFGGYSGKFIYPNYPDTNPVLLDRNNIKFNYDGVNYTATAPDGTQYIFSTIGKTISPGNSCATVASMPVTSYSWYLTKIISPDGNTATFAYNKYTSGSLPILSQSFSENQIGGAGSYLSSQGFYTNYNFVYPISSYGVSDNTTYSTSQEDNLILTSITTANATVVFNTSPREDVDQGVKLDNISIYRKDESAAFKSVGFTYGYFAGTTLFGDWTTNPNVVLDCGGQGSVALNPIPVAQRSERLKLKMIQFMGNYGSSQPPYQFIYDNSPMPYKTSLAQDLWGYFNGWNNNSLLPDYNQMGYFDSHVPLALLTSDFKLKKSLGVRQTVPKYLQAGMLKEIVNPTGGYTKITYEANHFDNLPGFNNQIRDTTLYVTDSQAGNKQITFVVPDIGYQGNVYINGSQTFTSINPATITVTLANPSSPCGVGAFGYNQSGGNNSNGLYAILEMWDPGSGQWTHTQNNIFDFTSTQWQNPACNGQLVYSSAIPELLVPGQYRITVNYPDNEQGGLPEPSASASINYKYISSQQYLNYGGGLRVKSIAEYTDANHMSNQKIYSYYAGKLMTKPVFYRNFLNFDNEFIADIGADQPMDYVGGIIVTCNGQIPPPWLLLPMNPEELPNASLSLYSNPLLNYSYAASGAAIGYDSVKVDYSVGQEIGETVYNYTNVVDNVKYFPGLLPGTPGGSYILNGSLLSQKELKKNADGSLIKIKEEDNAYIVNDFRDYWAYKTENVQPYVANCSDQPGRQPVLALSRSLYYNYLHFYPVKAGKVLLSQKNETFYDSPTPYTTTTIYQYNSQNQLNSTTVSKSDGRSFIQKTYYPGDYTVSSGFINQMQAKNMIDYPIEVINSVTNSNNTSSTLATSALYKEYYQHDNAIISPLNTYTFNSVVPVSMTPSVPGNVKDSHYELRETYSYDQYGNIIKYQKINGPVTQYLWDYNNLYPVAKITNVSQNDFAYTSFESNATGNWNYTGSGIWDSPAPTGHYSYNLSNGIISNNNLSSSKTYIVSYWTKNTTPFVIAGTVSGYPVSVRVENGWYNFKHKITGVSSITINGSGYIDELRLFPTDAQMQTYTYEPLIGVSSATDTKGNSTYYEYNNLQDLYNIKDLHGNILKLYNYNYSGFNPGMTPFANTALTQSFASASCPPGMGGSPINYTVPAGTYLSYNTQAAANDLAQSDINDNGQAYANVNGSCVVMPCSVGSILSAVKTSSTGYTLTYGPSVGSNVILRVFDTATGNQVAPPQTMPVLAGGSISGTIPVTGKIYSFSIMVVGVNCPGGVISNSMSLQF